MSLIKTSFSRIFNKWKEQAREWENPKEYWEHYSENLFERISFRFYVLCMLFMVFCSTFMEGEVFYSMLWICFTVMILFTFFYLLVECIGGALSFNFNVNCIRQLKWDVLKVAFLITAYTLLNITFYYSFGQVELTGEISEQILQTGKTLVELLPQLDGMLKIALKFYLFFLGIKVILFIYFLFSNSKEKNSK